ncbi:hypothetical protein [Azospirillum sp. SYSU D00513]|uniref:hypothetical protein n=1 Tax=Azospirillum sp. SYSU D00513 TaxID=2812561 RepID=UPI001A95E487|nr:hypothetical protein [Azospirillum sp. SYSU D00513]
MANKDEPGSGRGDEGKKQDMAKGMSESAGQGSSGSTGAAGGGSDRDPSEMAESSDQPTGSETGSGSGSGSGSDVVSAARMTGDKPQQG